MPHVVDGSARVTLAIVVLGYHERMIECLKYLAAFDDAEPFDIVCVVNAADPESPLREFVPDGVRLVEFEANLGWVGGLHAARAEITVPRMAWMQDDLLPEPGWLDAMVRALDEDPRRAMCGAKICGPDGTPRGPQAGFTLAGVIVREWLHSDIGIGEPDQPVVDCAWVPSAGSVIDVAAWDAVGGVDIRLYPLGFADFDYSSHIRAHGFTVAHVADARVRHERHASSPGELSIFASTRNLDRIGERWEEVVWSLGPFEARPVEHECSPWLGEPPRATAERAVIEGSRFVVPFARHVDEVLATLREEATAALEVESSAALRAGESLAQVQQASAAAHVQAFAAHAALESSYRVLESEYLALESAYRALEQHHRDLEAVNELQTRHTDQVLAAYEAVERELNALRARGERDPQSSSN